MRTPDEGVHRLESAYRAQLFSRCRDALAWWVSDPTVFYNYYS